MIIDLVAGVGWNLGIHNGDFFYATYTDGGFLSANCRVLTHDLNLDALHKCYLLNMPQILNTIGVLPCQT